MKTLKYVLILALVFFISCSDDDSDLSFVDKIAAPSNVSVLLQVTQDNTGLVTITPSSEGGTTYNITLGDGTEESVSIGQGENIEHAYPEGTYTITIEAVGITGLKTSISKDLVVSFNAPENLVVTLENDGAISKQVNVTATADFAMLFEVDFGDGSDVVQANIGETASHVFQDAGIYTITVTAMGAAIETTTYTEVDFEVTAILQPIASAPGQPSRQESDVISVFSDAYTDIAGTDFFPNWGQSTVYTAFDLDGDAMIQYSNLNYEGINIGSAIDASTMETLHIDIWTAEDLSIDIYPLPGGVVPDDERFVTKSLVANQWNSFDIPLTDFSDQGLPLDNLMQFKFVGTPAGGTVFIDNLYFYKEGTGGPSGGPLPINFEDPFVLSSFDGGDISVVDNPDTNGNSSTKVAQLIKDAGQPWAGSKITIDTPFEITESMTVTAKVWAPRAGLNLLIKFEDANPWPDTVATAEITATTTVANAWEELTFTITGVDASLEYYNLVLIMDNGTQGDGSSDYTIYVDDISVASFLDFEPNFALSSFDGGDISVVDNPDTNGNSSTKVAQLIKDAGQPWAGSKITVDTPFEITESMTITAKVWAPRAGLNLLMKFEDANPWPDTAATAEITATTTVANAWEELTYTITGVDASLEYYNLVLIMDNGTQGDGSSDYTIYVDDIEAN